jgi:hypothetical protein
MYTREPKLHSPEKAASLGFIDILLFETICNISNLNEAYLIFLSQLNLCNISISIKKLIYYICLSKGVLGLLSLYPHSALLAHLPVPI